MPFSTLSTAELICERNDLLHIDHLAAAVVELEIAKRVGSLERETSELAMYFDFKPETEASA